MPGTIGGLPYPTGTDRVVDGDNAIRDLAIAVTQNPNAVATNIATATPGTGWANLGTGTRYIAINGWVHLYIRMSRSGSTSLTICSIPVAFAPIETFRIPGNVDNSVCAIQSNGNITIDSGNPNAAITAFVCSAAYPMKGA